ncbi:MAG: FkbM family methyltransferase [candidate division WOR-3 bacterium]
MNLNKTASLLLSEDTREILRDQFYLRLPRNNYIFRLISTLMPTFHPITGYLKKYTPKNAEIVIDAGAYPGNFTIILSRLVGKNGRVIAIEPDKKFFAYLNSRFNRLGLKNIILLNFALWNSDGERNFLNRGNEGSSLFAQNSSNHRYTTTIPTRRLDTIVGALKIPRVDYLKMDIEGAEIEALEGATEVLKKYSPHLAIACYHMRNGKPTFFTLRERLKKLDYQVIIDFPKHLTLYGKKIRNTG